MKYPLSLKTMLATGALALTMLAGNAQAQYDTTVWNPAANPSTTGSWDEAANWTGGAVPDGTSVTPGNTWKAVFNVSGAVTCLVNSATSPGQVVIGDNGPGSMIVGNGGSIVPQHEDWLGVGFSGFGYLEVQSGASITLPSHLWIGFQSPGIGTFIMNGGTVNVGQMLGIGWNGGLGSAHINGGTLNLAQLHPTQSIMPGCVMDIAGGTVVITGNYVNIINNYVATNAITAYGGTGTLNVNYDAGANTTTITANNGSGGAPPQRNITNITKDGAGNVTLTYATTAGFTYHVLSADSLTPPVSWNPVAGSTTNNVSGSSVTVTFTPSSTTSGQFYRSVSP